MPIRDTLTNLAAIQDGLSISSPVSQSIKKAYKYPPSRAQSLEPPCFVNTWSFPDQSVEDGSFSQGHHRYTITMQMFAVDADLERGLEIATSFWEAWLTAWVGDQQLKNGGASEFIGASLTGSDPTIALLEWNGVSYPGWTATLDGIVSRT